MYGSLLKPVSFSQVTGLPAWKALFDTDVATASFFWEPVTGLLHAERPLATWLYAEQKKEKEQWRQGVPEEWSRPVLGSNTGTAILSNSGAEDRSGEPRERPAGVELQHSQLWEWGGSCKLREYTGLIFWSQSHGQASDTVEKSGKFCSPGTWAGWAQFYWDRTCCK